MVFFKQTKTLLNIGGDGSKLLGSHMFWIQRKRITQIRGEYRLSSLILWSKKQSVAHFVEDLHDFKVIFSGKKIHLRYTHILLLYCSTINYSNGGTSGDA